MIDQLATLFCKMSKAERVTALNVLAHILPTTGVNFDKTEEESIEHTIDMLQKALILHEYTGPSQEELMKHVALLNLSEIAEEVDEPSYVDPDRDQTRVKKKEEVTEPNFEPAE